MKIIKRQTGERVDFNKEKVIVAITKANSEMTSNKDKLAKEEIERIATEIEEYAENRKRPMNVEEIQNLVEKKLMKCDKYNLTKAYITYRYHHQLKREGNCLDEKMLSIADGRDQEAKEENANKNPEILSVQRDYYAGEISRDITRRLLLPKKIKDAHDDGIIHFHDTDYFLSHEANCCLINLEDMFQNGTVISNTLIERPHAFTTACNVATQIIAQVASSQYGGSTISIAHLAPFVEDSRQKFIKEKNNENEEILSSFKGIKQKFLKFLFSTKIYSKIFDSQIAKKVEKEIEKGVQMLQYQIVTLMTTNGQTPFVSFGLYLNEAKSEKEKDDLVLIIKEIFNQRIMGLKNENGQLVTPAFPKLLYFLQEDNIKPKTKYWWLTELAAKCTIKRMVPDYISEKKMKEYKNDNAYPCMGCRSFLNVWKDDNDHYKFYGRFNKGVVTLNLVDIALSSEKNIDEFWKIFDERLELCHEALLLRYERLKGTKSDIAPIMWQHGALARLNKGETIDNLLENGYSSISLGYGGLYECVKYMTDHSHTDSVGRDFAFKVMNYLNDACNKWNLEKNLGFSLYGSPMESTTYKFAKTLQKRFGTIEGITDKNYITNSYHVNPEEPIDAFTKLKLESEFQKLSPGGAISYVEIPNMNDNVDGVLSIIQYIYDNIMYAELNTRDDVCRICDYHGQMEEIKDKDGIYHWLCPKCGNTDQTKMNVSRRVCGYIESNEVNQGKMDEYYKRVYHLQPINKGTPALSQKQKELNND